MKIAILGYGKMGKAIEGLAREAGHDIVLKISSENAAECHPENLKQADVAIEFSRPGIAFMNIERCLEAGVPVVSGTTGWLDRKGEIETKCNDLGGAFLYASNFSIGVNLFFALNRYLASLMDAQTQYEVSLEEIHHTQKLDAPSGTAISLAEDMIEQLDRKQQWVGEEKATGTEMAIPIRSKRIAEVPGTHEISYKSGIDTITIRHEAHSREGFAKGALQAAVWIVGKKGCFDIKDMLGF